MKPVLIVQNVKHTGPGLIADVLEELNAQYAVVKLDDGDELPDPVDYQAIIILSGPDSANDDTPRMRAELEWAKSVLVLGTPCFGVGLGLQVLVKAAGGRVITSPFKEVGTHGPDGVPFRVHLTIDGYNHSLTRGLTGALPVFQRHGETVDLGEGMARLGVGEHCANQLVQITPTVYGAQFCLEITPELLAVWIDEDPDLQRLDKVNLLWQFEIMGFEYARNGRALIRNFLRSAGLPV